MSEPAVHFTATLPRKRVGAAVIFRDADGRVLLVEPTYRDHWLLPGGAVDPDESPYAAAVREVAEELGLSVKLGRMLTVDWSPPVGPVTEGLHFIYDGGILDPAAARRIRLPADELRSWAWSTPAEAATLLVPTLARRTAASLAALDSGTTHYLENGHPTA